MPTPADLAHGWAFANYLVANAHELELSYVIWQEQIWQAAASRLAGLHAVRPERQPPAEPLRPRPRDRQLVKNPAAAPAGGAAGPHPGSVERDETDLRHDQRAAGPGGEVPSSNRQTADAKRSIDDAKQAARREIDQRAATPGVGGRRASFFGLGTGSSTQNVDDQLLVWALPVAAVAARAARRRPPRRAPRLTAAGPGTRSATARASSGGCSATSATPVEAWEPVNTGRAGARARRRGGAPSLLVAVVAGLVGLLVWAMARPAGGARQRAGRAPRTARAARGSQGRRTALVLGTSGGHRLGVRDRHSVLVVGPAHSGKSSGLTVPGHRSSGRARWSWPRPRGTSSTRRSAGAAARATSTSTTRRRSRPTTAPAGRCWPSAPPGRAPSAPQPTSPSRPGRRRLGRHRAGAIARAGRPVAQLDGHGARALPVRRRVERPVDRRRRRVDRAGGARRGARRSSQGVDRHGRPGARDRRSCATTPSRSAFLHAMHQILSVYEDPAVAASLDRHEIVPEELLDGGRQHPVPDHARARPGPLPSAVRHDRAAGARHRLRAVGRTRAAPLDSPLLVVLDDVLGIAPIYDLASLASTAPARGVQLVSVFQDTGPDRHPLRRRRRPRRSATTGPSSCWPARPDAGGVAADLAGTPSSPAQLGAGEAALLYGTPRRPGVRLRPWFRDRELRAPGRDAAGRRHAGRRAARSRESRAEQRSGVGVAAARPARRRPRPRTRPSRSTRTIPASSRCSARSTTTPAPQNVTPDARVALAGRGQLTRHSTSNTAVTGRWSEMAAKRARSPAAACGRRARGRPAVA